MTTNLMAPPAISSANTMKIVQRYSTQTASAKEAYWATRSKAHCGLMAPMGNDKRIEYLGTAGCDDDTTRLITRTVADIIGKTAKPALQHVARECIRGKEDIESLLDKWPHAEHFQLLASKFADLTNEQIALATAYAACQIYETAATALYLTIVDGMDPVTTEEPSDTFINERDRAIADAGYTDEVARWPK